MITVTYDTDYAEWSARTAELIRAGRFSEIDAENVAGEIEDLGKSERAAVRSHLQRLPVHKITDYPAGAGWPELAGLD